MDVQPYPADLTPVAQDYLKAVWSAQEWSEAKVTVKHLADRMGVGVSTVSETVRRLCTQGLLDHAPYKAIELTPTGRRHALAMVRRHRLIETYLVVELGYGWDEVHDEAEVMEHAVSDLLVDRIDAKLGFPTRDPHGDPIPGPDGAVTRPDAVPLSGMAPGASGTVVRISDADPAALRYLGELGLELDVPVEVTARREYAGTVAVRWGAPGTTLPDGDRTADLGLLAASRVWVSA